MKTLTKRGRPREHTQTPFAAWLEATGHSYRSAAEALGVSVSQVANWAAGVDRVSGRPAAPPRGVEVLMRLLYEGGDTTQWSQMGKKGKREVK